jgi:hypothetical protein
LPSGEIYRGTPTSPTAWTRWQDAEEIHGHGPRDTRSFEQLARHQRVVLDGLIQNVLLLNL